MHWTSVVNIISDFARVSSSRRRMLPFSFFAILSWMATLNVGGYIFKGRAASPTKTRNIEKPRSGLCVVM